MAMGQVKEFGFFRELRPNDPSLPGIESGQENEPDPEALEVAEYLRSGVVYIAVPGTITDVLIEENPVIGAAHYLTDGEWIWPNELAYLVEMHRVVVPDEFRERMRSRGWRAPSESEVDLLEVEKLHLEG